MSAQLKSNRVRKKFPTIFLVHSLGMKASFHSSLAAKNKGISLIEILVAISIISVALVSLMGLFSDYIKIAKLQEKNIEAINLAQEAIEAIRAIRDESWTNFSDLTLGAIYHPAKQGTPQKWILTPGAETINEFFLREVIFENALRDVSGNIVESAGVADPDTKKITSTVCWNSQTNCTGAKDEITLITYISNWK